MSEFTQQLSNCTLTKLTVDTEHFYYLNGEYVVSVTQILDIGAPFPEGLRQWLRLTDADESAERLEMTKDRGTKLHFALESMMMGLGLYLEDYPTTYEKDAITTFRRCMRFLVKYGDLDLGKTKTELIVADTKLKLGGTLDLYARADKRALEILCNPTYSLKLVDDDLELVKPLIGKKKIIGFVWDHKFTGRSSYNHKVQSKTYQRMFNNSYAPLRASESYTWRYSPKHKFGFEFNNASIHKKQKITAKSFDRIFATAIEYLGGYPKPPIIKSFPEFVQLWEKKVNNKEIK